MVEPPEQPTAALRHVRPQRRWVLIACCLASCANLSQPPTWVFQPPGGGPFNVQWAQYGILNSVVTMLTLGFLLVGGVVGDIAGRRRVLLLGIGGMVVANMLLLVSPAVGWFYVTRFLSSVSGAVVLPLSLTAIFLTHADQPRRRAIAIAIYVVLTNAVFLLSGTLGLLMLTLGDWRTAFILPTVLGVLAFAVAWRWVPESRIEHRRRFEAIGLAAWALTLLGLAFGIVLWRVAGAYATAVVSASLLVSAVGFALLLWWDYRTPDSIFGSAALPRRYLAVLVLAGVAMQIGTVGYMTQVRSHLIAVYGYGVVLASVALAPLLIGMAGMVVVGTRRIVGARARGLIAAGIMLTGVVCVLTAMTRAGAFYPWLALLLVLFGAGFVTSNTAFTNVFLQSIAPDLVGVRTGIVSAILQIGGALGNAFSGALLATIGVASYRRQLAALGGDGLPGALEALQTLFDPATVAVVTAQGNLAALVGAEYRARYLVAFQITLLVLAGVCVLGSLVVWYGLQPRTARDEVKLALP